MSIRSIHSFALLSAALLVALTAAGCGGDGSHSDTHTATISGLVTDIDGNPVRGAYVHSRDASTTSSVSGSYVLTGNREDDLIVVAELNQDGVNYSGQNLARTFEDGLSQSVNIVVYPDGDQAQLKGNVRDFNDNPLQGVSVFAFGGGVSGSRGITDENGDYIIRGLVPGFQYTVNAGGLGYQSSEVGIVFDPREVVTQDFTIGQTDSIALDPPTNLGAVSWTAPAANRSSERAAYEAIKKRFDPRHRVDSASRSTYAGRQVEVELFFDPVLSLNLLGYGIYRAQGTANFNSVTFLREPIAGYFVDLDSALQPFTNYAYAVTSLNTLYPNASNSESDFSNEASVQTLGDLTLVQPTLNPLTFRWISGSGSEEYAVYVFDTFPGVDVSSIWSNEEATTTALSVQYTGPALQPGKRYYYIVLGLANDRNSRALSEIGSFIAP